MYLPQYTERKGSKIPENRQMEHPDTLRNQQVMCSSHTTSSKKALKSQRLSPIGTQCEPMGLKLLWGKESVGYGVAISHWFWDYMRHKAEGADHIQE